MSGQAQVIRVLQRVLDRVIQSELVEAAEGNGLSLTQYHALRFLEHTPGAELASLAEALGISAPAATKLATRLENGGFIERQVSSEDRRRTLPQLTEQARAALGELAGSEEAILQQILDRMPSEVQADLMRGALAFIRAAKVDNLDGLCLFCGQRHRPDCPLVDR